LKNAIFSFLAVLAVSIVAHAQSSWVAKSKIIGGDLIAVFFTSADTGWVAGDNGYLARTSDGGSTWARVPLNTTEDINEIYFRNEDNGYLVAGRKFFITRDAGRTWQDVRIFRTGEFGAGRPEFLSIRFSDRKRGDSWRRIAVPTKAELFHVDFNGNSNGWIVGDNGVILATTDGGSTWAKQTSGTAMPLYNVDFRDDREGYAVGKSGTILRTSNGGSTWEKVATNMRETLMRVDFADDKNGWIVGYSGSILRSGDKGRTWVKQEGISGSHLYGLYMDKKFGWAVGAKGTVLYFKR
jgi:photosystem II stability/assembly factor-like uncharacterized protein